MFNLVKAIALCLLTPLCVVGGEFSVKGQHPAELRDTRGDVIPIPDAKLVVYCFLGTECPLAKLYGPRLQSLADSYEEQSVDFIGIVSNKQDSPLEIERYARRHSIQFPIAKDSNQHVAEQLNATRTPEVVMLDRSGVVQYRGRIDDQYEPGISKKAARSNDLKRAIDEYLRGDPISVTRTDGVGCLITRVKDLPLSPTNDSAITFSRDIAPILNEHCVECHRPGEIGPFALSDYDEVIGWAEMILEVIDQKRMPPWHADPDIGDFIGSRSVPKSQRDTIAKWIQDGMPQGKVDETPRPPSFTSGWHLETTPDLEIAMRERPFVVPADGVVEYQYFVVDPKWEEDKWVRAAQVIPGDASVVHHAIVFVRPPDGQASSGIGWLGAYVPGQRTIPLPSGHARRIPAGSKLVFQMHYTPTGTPAEDVTRLGVWFSDAQSVTNQVTTHIALNHEFEIPPKDDGFEVRLSSRSFPQHGKLLGITPHMHFRGKSFRLFAQPRGRDEAAGTPDPPDDRASAKEWLRVPRYDFNWQHWYAFQQPKDLNDVDSLEMLVEFDNSWANPFNPDPNEYVSWGDQTWEEMAVAFYDVATPLGAPLHRIRPVTNPSESFLEQMRARGEAKADQFFAEMDRNGDGIVELDETPETFRRFGFHRMDHNGDRKITRDEVLEEASIRN